MSNGEFYFWGSKLLTTTFQAGPVFEDPANDTQELDFEYELIYGNYKGINFPVVFRQDYGKKLLDVLDTGFAGLKLISDRLKMILEDNKFTGWKTYPVKVFTKKNEQVPGYYGFSITGRCGPLDYSRTEIVAKRLVKEGPLLNYFKGARVNVNDWDKCDIFLVNDTFFNLVTEPVKKILTDENVTNLKLLNLKDIEFDEFTKI